MTSLLSPTARKLILGGALFLAAAPPAPALDLRARFQPEGGTQEFVWIAPGGGNWSNGANWQGGIAPPAGGGGGVVLRFTGVGPSGGYFATDDLPGLFDLAGMVLDNRRGSLYVATGIRPSVTANTAAPVLRMGEGAFLEQRGGADGEVALGTRLDGAVTVRGSQFGALSLYSVLSGTGSLVVNRADGGIVFLGATDSAFPGNNTFSGGVELRSGQLFLQRASALGTGTLTIFGGAVSASTLFPPPGSNYLPVIPNAVNLHADLRWTGQQAAVLSGAIAGEGGLRVDLAQPQIGNNRTLALQGAASFTGATRVEALNTLSVGGTGGALTATSGVAVQPFATLEIDHRGDGAAALGRLGDAVPVTLHAGRLSVIGSAQGPVGEAMGALRGGSGLGTVQLGGAAGAAADPAVTLAAASFSAAPGAVVRFSGRQPGTALPGTTGVDSVLFADAAGTLGQLVGAGGPAGTPTLSILPGALGLLPAGQRDAAVPTGTSFVTYDPVNGVRPLRVDTEYRRTIMEGTVSADNVFLSGGTTINASTTVNSLLLAGGLGGDVTLRVTSGMVVGGGPFGGTILNVARLDFGAQPGRVIVDTNYREGFNSRTFTISSAISGSSGVAFLGEVTGDAMINLSGVNTFTGPLIIAAFVNANAGAAALGGTGPVQLDGGGRLNLPNGDTLQRDLLVGAGGGGLGVAPGTNGGITLAGRLLGAGELSIPSGTVALAGGNGNFSGRLVISGSGELRFSSGNQLGTPSEIVLAGSSGGGRLTNTATTTLNMPLRLLGPAPSFYNVTIETRADLTLTQGIGGNATTYGYSQPTLVKAGAGTLRLQGDNSFQGVVTVQAGTLIVNGIFSKRDVPGVGLTVAAGARLGGNGLIHRDVSLAGSVAPGDFAPGLLTLDGDLAVGTAAALEWDRAASAADLLAVNGRVTFSGGTFTLRLHALDGAQPSGADVLLRAGEGIDGTLPTFALDFTDAPAWASLGLHAEVVNGSLVLVPEPGSWAAALVLGGGALLLARARRGRPSRATRMA